MKEAAEEMEQERQDILELLKENSEQMQRILNTLEGRIEP